MATPPYVFFLATSMGLLLDKYLLQTGSATDQFMTGHYSLTDIKSCAVAGPLFKASTLIGYPVGMATFGPISDVVGRRACLITTAVLTFVGALGCTCAWNPWVVIVFRFITGIGAGGEYPLAAVHTADGQEDRSKSTRAVGYFYAWGSGFGQFLCPLVALILVCIFPTTPQECDTKPVGPGCNETNNQIVWRGTFAVAAVLSLVGLVLRVKTTENGDLQARRELASPMGLVAKYWRPLLSTALSWFFYDIVEYGLKNNDVDIFSGSGVKHGLEVSMTTLGIQIIFLLVAANSVYFVAAKWNQLFGFSMLTIVNFIILFLKPDNANASKGLFRTMYVIQTGFQAFPGITTMAVPAEIFPGPVRGTCHAISAVTGKLGAIIGSYFFDYVKDKSCGSGYTGFWSDTPVRFIFLLVTISCACGMLVSIVLTPRYDGRSLQSMDERVAQHDHKGALEILYGGSARRPLAAERDNA